MNGPFGNDYTYYLPIFNRVVANYIVWRTVYPAFDYLGKDFETAFSNYKKVKIYSPCCFLIV